MEKKRILLVDDEAGFTHILKLTLPEYEIREENDARRALETARRFKPDLIFLDVIMPAADGGEVAAQIRSDPSLKHVPIVFLTAIVSPDEAATNAQIGGYPFLAKPVSRERVIECIQEQLAVA